MQHCGFLVEQFNNKPVADKCFVVKMPQYRCKSRFVLLLLVKMRFSLTIKRHFQENLCHIMTIRANYF